MMEKNGAISNKTPSGCRNCGCNNKQAQDNRDQLLLFPEDAVTADELESCLAKSASDAVKNASKRSS